MLDNILGPRVSRLTLPIDSKIMAAVSTPKLLGAFAVLFFTGCFAAALQFYPLAIICCLIALYALALYQKAGRESLTNLALFGGTGAFIFFFSLGLMNSALAGAFAILALGLCGMIRMIQQRAGAVQKDFSGYTEIALFILLSCLFPGGFAALAALFGLLWLAGAGWQMLTVLRD
jgi:hypothetical protein